MVVRMGTQFQWITDIYGQSFGGYSYIIHWRNVTVFLNPISNSRIYHVTIRVFAQIHRINRTVHDKMTQNTRSFMLKLRIFV